MSQLLFETEELFYLNESNTKNWKIKKNSKFMLCRNGGGAGIFNVMVSLLWSNLTDTFDLLNYNESMQKLTNPTYKNNFFLYNVSIYSS